MKISVVIPVYNVEKYIRECVESVLSQDFADFELLLVDDGSTDRSGSICDELSATDRRIRVFHKKNGGLSDARNYGIERAEGEYITFIDSDDFILPAYLSTLEELARQYHADVSCTQAFVSGNRSERPVKGKTEKARVTGEEAVSDSLLRRYFGVSAWGKLYKTSLFSATKFPVGQLFEDLLTIPYIFEKCAFVAYTTDKLYFYYDRAGSITHSRITEKHMMIIDNTIELIRHIDIHCQTAHNAAIARFCIESIKRLVDVLLLTDGYFSRIGAIRAKCEKYWREGLHTSLVPRSIKVQIQLIRFSPLFYWLCFRPYKKMKGNRNKLL